MTRLLLALIDQVPPAGALLTAMAVVYLRRTERAFTTLTRTQVSVVVIAAGALAALWQGRVWTLGIDTEWARWVQDWLVYWDVTDGDSRFMDTGYLYMFLVISLVMTGVLMGHVMGDRIRRRRWTPRTLSWLLLVGWALSGLVQVLPAWDARHVWWSLPAALVLLFAALGSVTRLSRVTRNPFWIPLGVAGLAACLGGIAYVGSPRVEAPASSLASGMWVTRQSAQSLASDLELLSSISVNYGARPLVFLTEDGDLSVAGGRYASADPFFVGWGPVPPLTARVAAEPMIVVTKGWGESKWGAAMQDMEGYRLVAENERARVYAPEG